MWMYFILTPSSSNLEILHRSKSKVLKFITVAPCAPGYEPKFIIYKQVHDMSSVKEKTAYGRKQHVTAIQMNYQCAARLPICTTQA